VEVFWHRGGESDGRVWMAINGEVVVNRHVDLIRGNPKPINRIFVHQLYTGGRYPAFQWVDDLQIWSDFPRTDPQDPNNNAREGDPWFDNKYGPH
jgi:hypothetical protein